MKRKARPVSIKKIKSPNSRQTLKKYERIWNARYNNWSSLVLVCILLLIFFVLISISKESIEVPGDRLCGETACLSHLPSMDQLYLYNRQVIPLNNDEIGGVLSGLSTIDGINSDVFWCAFDQCNCGQFFTKAFLHSVHGPLCPTWPYIDTPAPTPEPSHILPVAQNPASGVSWSNI